MAENAPGQNVPAQDDVITPEEIERMSPAEQRQVANALKETAIFLSEVSEEDLRKLQEIPWEKLQQPPDPNRPMTEEDAQGYRELWQLVQDGHVTMAQVLGYSEAELSKIFQTGMGLANQGRYDDALKLTEGLLFLVPNMVAANLLRAECLRKKGDIDGALDAYNKAVSADPTNVVSYWERAKLFFAIENVPNFLMDIESVANLDPEAKTFFGKRARTLLEAAEQELLSQGFTEEQIAQAEEQLLGAMSEVPLDQVPEIDDQGHQIRK